MILLLLVQRDFDLNFIWKIVFVASSSCSRILSSTPSPSISSAPEMSPTRIRSRIRPILTKPPNVYPARKCFCRYLINVCVCVFVCVCVCKGRCMGGLRLRWQEVYSACPTVVGWVFSSLCANVMSIVQESNITIA